MTEIEFLDPGATTGAAGGGPDGSDDPDSGPDLRQLVPALAAAVAWVLAAGLAVMASVSSVYRLVYHSGKVDQSISVDAWGRLNTSGLSQSIGHQTRYAIVLIAAAVLLLAAALVAIVRLPLARYVAVAGAAVAGATTVTLILSVQATRSTNDIRARQIASQFTLRTDFGSAVWLTLGAAAAGAVGIVLAFVLKAPADPAPGAVPATRPATPATGPTTEPEAVEPVPGGGGPAIG